MNAKLMSFTLTATLMMSVVACDGFKARKHEGKGQAAGKPTPPAPPAPKADAQCPQNIEGLWEVKGEPPVAFGIGKNEQGLLQMTLPTLQQSIVFDGQARLIPFKENGVATGTGGTFTGKCEDGVIYISARNVIDNEGTEVETVFEYRLNADELAGNVTEKQNGQIVDVKVIGKN